MPILNRIADFQPDLIRWRKHLHAHPELMFDCHQTAAFVAERLREFGVDEIHTGIATSGVVALIKGRGGAGPVIGLRADMDALPITEVTRHDYASTVPGRMHACGHDGHTTMLLGAARYLAETRNFTGTVALIFQPAEEGGGGARVMLNEGLFERFGIDQVYAIHNWPGLPEGMIAVGAGPVMAAADEFTITITGKGAHAAMPQLSTDPVLIAAQIATAAQVIPARNTDPLEALVLSITQIHAGEAFNVIPETAMMNGTARSLSKSVRTQTAKRLKALCEGIAAAHGAQVEVDYRFGYPVTVNDPSAAQFARDVGAQVTKVAKSVVPSMGAEDFSYMLEKRRGAYVFLGQGDTAGLHHPQYDFNDDIAPIGASFFVKLVEVAQPIA